MEDQNTVNYREALRALWDLEAAPPEKPYTEDDEWFYHWREQAAVIEDTTLQVADKVGYVGVLRIIVNEHKAWEAEQEPKAEA